MHRWVIYTTAMVILILFTTPLEMAEGKTIVMEEKNVKIRPGSMLKMKLNGFTKGASARIQVAVNQKMCNRTVNVYLAYSYQLVGTSPDELHYKQCPISRENATNVDVNYVNEDGKEYYFVVANVEKFAGERDLPGGDAVVSYKIEITPPEKEKSSLPTIIIGIVVLLVFLVIAVV
ncbi:MAG: hypothetical protein J7L88_04430, partial [Thermoplasmata archaeon]|nr:hypothetical protein [Thermoplasmata archaeon]